MSGDLNARIVGFKGSGFRLLGYRGLGVQGFRVQAVVGASTQKEKGKSSGVLGFYCGLQGL